MVIAIVVLLIALTVMLNIAIIATMATNYLEDLVYLTAIVVLAIASIVTANTYVLCVI
jgi:hypothetical protein